MKKALKAVRNVFFSCFYFLFFSVNHVSADVYGEPMRVRQAESIFANVIIAVWALSIPYFMFVVGSIGAQWMLSGGDEQKLGELKKRGGNVALSFVLVFGGYLVVKLVMSLLGLKSPEAEGGKCFTSPIGDNVIFKFFFPEACE